MSTKSSKNGTINLLSPSLFVKILLNLTKSSQKDSKEGVPFMKTLVGLTQVSKTWSKIMLNSPSLWSNLDIHLHGCTSQRSALKLKQVVEKFLVLSNDNLVRFYLNCSDLNPLTHDHLAVQNHSAEMYREVHKTFEILRDFSSDTLKVVDIKTGKIDLFPLTFTFISKLSNLQIFSYTSSSSRSIDFQQVGVPLSAVSVIPPTFLSQPKKFILRDLKVHLTPEVSSALLKIIPKVQHLDLSLCPGHPIPTTKAGVIMKLASSTLKFLSLDPTDGVWSGVEISLPNLISLQSSSCQGGTSTSTSKLYAPKMKSSWIRGLVCDGYGRLGEMPVDKFSWDPREVRKLLKISHPVPPYQEFKKWSNTLTSISVFFNSHGVRDDFLGFLLKGLENSHEEIRCPKLKELKISGPGFGGTSRGRLARVVKLRSKQIVSMEGVRCEKLTGLTLRCSDLPTEAFEQWLRREVQEIKIERTEVGEMIVVN